jgi:hypothetical protein
MVCIYIICGGACHDLSVPGHDELPLKSLRHERNRLFFDKLCPAYRLCLVMPTKQGMLTCERKTRVDYLGVCRYVRNLGKHEVYPTTGAGTDSPRIFVVGYCSLSEKRGS